MSKKPVILQVLPRLESGGVERGTLEITSALRRANMIPIVASSGGTLIPHVKHAGGEHITMPLDSKNPIIIRNNAKRLLKLIKSHDVDIIHARSRAPAWAAYYAAKWAGIPFVTTFHGIYSTENFVKKYYNSVMARGNRIIAVSQFVRDHIVTKYKVDPAIIRTIPRGVDFNLFDESKLIPDRLLQLSKSWLLYDNFSPVILCPGRISRIKGQHELIEALAKLTDIPFLCIIAGTDFGHEDYREELEHLIRARGLEGKVRIASATTYMAEAYMLSSIVIVPSIQPESFGRVAVEAQAMGKLVIATDHGGARETILPHETGYLVPPADADMMAQAIRFALSRDENMVKAMGDFAIAHAKANFNSEKMKADTLAVYAELLGPNVSAVPSVPLAVRKESQEKEKLPEAV